MRQKCVALLAALLFMLAIGVLRDTGAVGNATAVARAAPYCVEIFPAPPLWQGGIVCFP